MQQQSGNARIQTGQPGYFEATDFVALIEKPARLDRSLGDIHAAGNPHIHLDPRNVAEVAPALGERMAMLDAKEAGHYRERTKAFSFRTARWEKSAERLPSRGAPQEYLLWLGMREVGDWCRRARLGELLPEADAGQSGARGLRRPAVGVASIPA